MILSVFSPVWPLVVGTNSHNYLDIVDHLLMLLICFNQFSIIFQSLLDDLLWLLSMRNNWRFQAQISTFLSARRISKLNFTQLFFTGCWHSSFFTGCWHSSSPVLQECASRR